MSYQDGQGTGDFSYMNKAIDILDSEFAQEDNIGEFLPSNQIEAYYRQVYRADGESHQEDHANGPEGTMPVTSRNSHDSAYKQHNNKKPKKDAGKFELQQSSSQKPKKNSKIQVSSRLLQVP